MSGGLPELVGGGGGGGGWGNKLLPQTISRVTVTVIYKRRLRGEGRVSREISNLCHKLISHCNSPCGGFYLFIYFIP